MGDTPHLLVRPALAAVAATCRALAQPTARVEQTPDSAPGLSRDQAVTVIG